VIDPFVLDKKLDKWRKGPRTLTATCAHYNVRLDCAHDATQDALAAASIARRMAFLWPGELQIELPGLHNKQVLWHHEAAAEFQSYLQNKKGEADAFVQGDWPVQSLPTGWDPAARPRIQAGVAWLKELTAKKESNEGVREAERRIAAVNTANWLDLSHLALTDSDFWSLRPAICNLSALTNLDLSNNQLTALPQAIGNLTALTNLDLSNNQLTALPEAIGNLTALTKISLNDNQLTPLPQAISNLSALTTLQLSRNQLTALPQAISNLTALTWLQMSGNRLAGMPQAIGNLTALTTLELSGNHLTTLPQAIGNLTALGWLWLDDNHLTALPQAIGNLTALTTLEVSRNLLAPRRQAIVSDLDAAQAAYCSTLPFNTLP